MSYVYSSCWYCKGKAFPVQARTGLQEVENPRISIRLAPEGVKVVSPTHRPRARNRTVSNANVKKGKSVPLQAWSGPEGSRNLRFPDYMTTAPDGKVVSLMHRPPLPSGNAPVAHFC